GAEHAGHEVRPGERAHLGVEDRFPRRQRDPRRRSDVVVGEALADDAGADAGAGAVAPADYDRSAPLEAALGGGGGRDLADDVRRLADPRQLARVDPERLDKLVRPGPTLE